MFDKYFKRGTYDLDWEYIMSIPEFAALENCEQSPKWHGEGNALEHTKKCLEWAYSYSFPWFFGLDNKRLLIMCVLFHDIGKGVTTFFKKGSWHAYGHEVSGEHMARRLLWDEPISARETVCYCVRYHMEPLNIIGKNNQKFCAIGKMALDCSLFNTDTALIFTKYADIHGSVPSDRNVTKKNLNEMSQFARLLDSLGGVFGVRPEANGMINRRVLYDVKPVEVDKAAAQYVTVMVGLPGAGKDTLIDKGAGPWTQVVCRDDIREELGYVEPGQKAVLSKEKEEEVTKIFNERLCEYLDKGYNVVVNNVNLKRAYRDNLKTVVGNRPVIWKCVYVEAPSLSANVKRREGQIPAERFEEMVEKFDFPRYDEFDIIEISKQ